MYAVMNPVIYLWQMRLDGFPCNKEIIKPQYSVYKKYRKLRFLCTKKVHRSGIESDFRLIAHIRYIINCDEGERILTVDEIH